MPLVADGVVHTICVGVHELMVAVDVPNFTLPALEPKLRPAIVTFTPAWPEVGPIEPASGGAEPSVNCQTETVCAGSEKLVTGLFPPDPELTVIERPPTKPLR